MVEMNLTAENIQVETGVQVGEAMKSTLHLVQIFINITFCASIKMFTCLNLSLIHISEPTRLA